MVDNATGFILPFLLPNYAETKLHIQHVLLSMAENSVDAILRGQACIYV